MMDFGLAFSYVFKDKEWFKKLLIPALINLIPIIGQFVLVGWGLRTTKKLIDGEEEIPLPKLDFGADLGKGFMVMLITLIYAIPFSIFTGLGIISFIFSGNQDSPINYLLLCLCGCLTIFAILLGLLTLFLFVIGVANYVAKAKFGAAFRFKELIGMLKKSIVSWLLVILGLIAALLISPIGLFLCIIGITIPMTYSVTFNSHLLGQAYNKATDLPYRMEIL
jgi:hypothetical protein